MEVVWNSYLFLKIEQSEGRMEFRDGDIPIAEEEEVNLFELIEELIFDRLNHCIF